MYNVAEIGQKYNSLRWLRFVRRAIVLLAWCRRCRGAGLPLPLWCEGVAALPLRNRSFAKDGCLRMAIRSESLLSLSAFKPLHYNYYAPFFCAGAEIVGWHSCVRFAPYCKLCWTIALPLGKAGRKAFSIIYKAVRKRDVRENMRQAFSIIQTVAPIFRGRKSRAREFC